MTDAFSIFLKSYPTLHSKNGLVGGSEGSVRWVMETLDGTWYGPIADLETKVHIHQLGNYVCLEIEGVTDYQTQQAEQMLPVTNTFSPLRINPLLPVKYLPRTLPVVGRGFPIPFKIQREDQSYDFIEGNLFLAQVGTPAFGFQIFCRIHVEEPFKGIEKIGLCNLTINYFI